MVPRPVKYHKKIKLFWFARNVEEGISRAEEIGYPVMIKASEGKPGLLVKVNLGIIHCALHRRKIKSSGYMLNQGNV